MWHIVITPNLHAGASLSTSLASSTSTVRSKNIVETVPCPTITGPHAHGLYFDPVASQNLPCLIDEFPLFIGVASIRDGTCSGKTL